MAAVLEVMLPYDDRRCDCKYWRSLYTSGGWQTCYGDPGGNACSLSDPPLYDFLFDAQGTSGYKYSEACCAKGTEFGGGGFVAISHSSMFALSLPITHISAMENEFLTSFFSLCSPWHENTESVCVGIAGTRHFWRARHHHI